ncbi:glycosyl hydrolase 53 family protein [Neolewinella litorea]|uniref:Arabinogalactan endo-beta-1,4-galactanase n=1 Tax=Neolewinella litorea TaxID=2562452 RepID=A0A4S4NNR1_9BACT|nr:glycosyl hydrolase 53 family protein [Neolewinella litorea]THH37870.1 T9SS type A sorting domain-containing protein [Neolewinella litorea]
MKALYPITFLLLSGWLPAQCLQGVDLSYVNAIEQAGGIYRDADGERVDPYRYFADRGAEMVRLRLWHRPENIRSKCGEPISSGGMEDVLLAARKADSSGMGLNLAIHYGDYFVDPGKQRRPAAWDGHSGQVLLDSIYHYTYRTLERLHAQGTDPVIVAVGNETNNGFVDATEPTNGFEWAADADKFNAGLRAVRDFNTAQGTSIRSAIHLTENYARHGASGLTAAGVTDYDILGLSYYPHFNPQTTVAEIGELVSHLGETYDKEIMIFETGFSHNNTGGSDGYNNFLAGNGEVVDHPATPAGQRAFLGALSRTVCAAGGTAVYYWEPAWVSSGMCDAWGQGSSYENASWFDYDGRALPAFDWLSDDGTVSTQDEGLDVRTSVYPNPGGDTLNVESQLKVVEWQLLNTEGVVVAAVGAEAPGQSFTVRMRELPAGTYVLRLKMENGRWETRRVVVGNER